MSTPIIRKTQMLLVLMALMGGSGYAAAVVLDFEALMHADGANTDHGFVYIEDGFQFDELNQSQGLHTFGTLESRFTGSTALFNDTVNGVTRLTRVDNSLFSIISIDLAELNGSNVATVTFTGTYADTTTTVQAFTLDGIAFGAETFAFNNTFAGLQRLEWGQVNPFHQFDNLVMDAQVPEPATLLMLGVGLAGLGASRRRQR